MEDMTFDMMMKSSNIVYFNGKTVRDRFNTPAFPDFGFTVKIKK